ncbi:hypothetical protein BDZ89DRAFT_509859 [Hymenopellis radicata]|nr:hypothetical protein BDZ89DRAFT_509859 [Hymenopellis radicata]
MLSLLEFTRHTLRLKRILRGDTFLLSLTQNQYHQVRNRIISFGDVYSRISLTYVFANMLDSEFSATSDRLTYVYSRQLFNDFAVALGILSRPIHFSLVFTITLLRNTNPSKTIRLDAIASFLLGRYKKTHDTADLTLAIYFLQTVQQLRLGLYADDFIVDHFGTFSCLYAAYMERYKISDSVADLDAAISAMENAMKLEIPWSVLPGDRPEGLNALSTSLMERFTRLGDRRDMDRAMQCVEAALRLVPLDSPSQSKYQQTYALAMFSRYRLLDEAKDGDQAIRIYEDLVRTGLAPV